MLLGMAVSTADSDFGAAVSRASTQERGAVWPLWFALGSSLAAAFGVHWDIAWHRSIGRDAFWTPPHVAIYSAAVLAAIAALAQIVPATFGRRAEHPAAVRVLGFRGPLGAFISAWGGVTMLASAPFDDSRDARDLAPARYGTWCAVSPASHRQHHAELCVAAHHSVVSFGRFFERVRFNHRAYAG